MTFDGHRTDDHKPYIFVTRDLGETWTPVSGNLPDGNVNVSRFGDRIIGVGGFAKFSRGSVDLENTLATAVGDDRPPAHEGGAVGQRVEEDRAAQGVGAALMTPAALSILMTTSNPSRLPPRPSRSGARETSACSGEKT